MAGSSSKAGFLSSAQLYPCFDCRLLLVKVSVECKCRKSFVVATHSNIIKLKTEQFYNYIVANGNFWNIVEFTSLFYNRIRQHNNENIEPIFIYSFLTLNCLALMTNTFHKFMHSKPFSEVAT